MTTPEVRAACADLRADATKWSAAADALRGAEAVARDLTLHDKLGRIPQLAGSGTSFAGYDEFRRKAAMALAVGAVVFDQVSDLLTQAAGTYEEEDRAVAFLGALVAAKAFGRPSSLSATVWTGWTASSPSTDTLSDASVQDGSPSQWRPTA